MEDLYEDGVEVYILVDGLFQSGCLFAGLWRLDVVGDGDKERKRQLPFFWSGM